MHNRLKVELGKKNEFSLLQQSLVGNVVKYGKYSPVNFRSEIVAKMVTFFLRNKNIYNFAYFARLY